MKKHFLFLAMLVFFVFFLNLVSSVDIKTNYYIIDERVLVEHYFLKEVSNLELKIPYDAERIESPANYTLEKFSNYKIIKINYAKNFSIKYVTNSIIDKSNKKYYFTSQNYLIQKEQEVKLVLPESAILAENGILSPKPDSILTNGRNIILNWQNYDEDQIVVNYELSKNTDRTAYLITIIIILIFIIYSFLWKKYLRKKPEKTLEKPKKSRRTISRTKKNKRENLTANLLEDEKKIIEFLLERKNNEAWTKEILRAVGISKVKLSRKLKSLEKKELIKKIPYGNENKIRIMKK